MDKSIIRVNVKELMKAQIDFEIKSDSQLAEMMGVSASQVWRSKLQPGHEQYSAPGNQFIAGVLKVFKGQPFEKFFYLDEAN